jgi:arylsulfatase A-like enzyme
MTQSRRKFLKQVAAGSTLPLLATGAAPAAEAGTGSGKRPLNLLVVFPDEMRAQAQQFMGMDPVITPNLDRFAKQSCVMRQAVANYPLCTPARAMFMTGQYPIRNGMTGNCLDYTAYVGVDLAQNALCWSDMLKKKGYATGYIGKWHLDAPKAPYVESYNNPPNGTKWNEWCPPERRHGFDFWYSYGTFDLHLTPMYWTNSSTRDTPVHVKQWGPEHEADLAIRYLKNEGGKFRDASKPFALVVSMNPPHSPYDQVPQRYLDMYAGSTSRELNPHASVDWDKDYDDNKGPVNAKSYFAMVSGVDEQFGRILAALEEQKLSEDTLVVFFSDHGCNLGAHSEATKNTPFEESMRVPMMFRLPGSITPHMDDALMSMPDLYPTMMSLLGHKDAIPVTVEGTDLSARVKTGKGEAPTSQIYYRIPYGLHAFGLRGVRTERYTMVVDRRDKQTTLKYQLYDNLRDPLQMNNIAADNMPLVRELIAKELTPWLERTGDPWRAVPFDTSASSQQQAFRQKPGNCT